MKHLEIEYKTLLTKDEFKRLELLFSHVPQITQTNYYFDTADFQLKKHRLSLRIRTFSQSAELTLKIPQDVGNLEFNAELSLEKAKELIRTGHFPINTVTQPILDAGIDLSKLNLLGNLTTIRRESQIDIGLIALDSNRYAQIKDYELELEVNDASKGEADFQAFLDKYNINYKFAKSKLARFASTLPKN
ncbi:CYTH domain-containing protein [Streptococcus sp. sy004]|uniref:CYTH domain-containing protein n=1 Tax=Streptococcus sp. sy004 TaxID=2600149 RepID=UPI0011B447E5|nr:CYTH domain-containing protein [Streptococcus sp. sy004]TWT12365.1 CYTH domain-containing protein [Streptococcus sp. sy004]